MRYVFPIIVVGIVILLGAYWIDRTRVVKTVRANMAQQYALQVANAGLPDRAPAPRQEDSLAILRYDIQALRDSLAACKGKLQEAPASEPQRPRRPQRRAPKPVLTEQPAPTEATVPKILYDSAKVRIGVLERRLNEVLTAPPDTPMRHPYNTLPPALPDYTGAAPIPSALDFPVRSRMAWYAGVDVIPDTELGVYPVVGIQTSFDKHRRFISIETGASTNFTAIRFGLRYAQTFK